MSHKEYSAKLEELNIFINSKNFLVYQGKVEEIALKNAKERMHMFEEISESVQFKDDYIKVIPNTISSSIKRNPFLRNGVKKTRVRWNFYRKKKLCGFHLSWPKMTSNV